MWIIFCNFVVYILYFIKSENNNLKKIFYEKNYSYYGSHYEPFCS